jgi:hypothetical protein
MSWLDRNDYLSWACLTMDQSPTDPAIDEIRVIRRHISTCFGHDPAQVVAYYIELQAKYRDRLIGTPEDAEGRGERNPRGGAHPTGIIHEHTG